MSGSVIVLTPSVGQRESLYEYGPAYRARTPSRLARRPSDADRVITQDPEPLVFRSARVVFRRGPRVHAGISSANWGGGRPSRRGDRNRAHRNGAHGLYPFRQLI